MRHRKSGRQLNRNSSHRKAMLRSLACSIIIYESIKTTAAKAKEIKSFLEPLITLSKENTVANQRRAFATLRDKEAISKLFVDLGPRFKERPGGYLRIIKRGFRTGDKAPLVQVEFVTKQSEEEDQEVETLEKATS